MYFLDNKTLGSRIRTARLIANLSLQGLSEKTGISYSTLSRIENGKKKIQVEELIRISKFVNKPITYFVQDGNAGIEYFYPPKLRKEFEI